MATSPPSAPTAFTLFRAFPITEGWLHDVYMAIESVNVLGCGVYGYVTLQLAATHEEGCSLVFPARVVPRRGVQQDHVLMAETAMVLLDIQIGSSVKIVVCGVGKGSGAPLQLIPLFEDSPQLPCTLVERSARRLKSPGDAESLVLIRYLNLIHPYRTTKTGKRDKGEVTERMRNGLRSVDGAEERGEDRARGSEEDLQSRKCKRLEEFHIAALQQILEVVAQNQSRRDAFRIGGLLLSAPKGGGKTVFAQRLRQLLQPRVKMIYMTGQDVLGALMASESGAWEGGVWTSNGGIGGEEEVHLRERLGLGEGDDAQDVVLFIDDFDELLSGREAGISQEDAKGASGPDVDGRQGGIGEQSRGLRRLQELLGRSSERGRLLCWVLATRERVRGEGGSGMGGAPGCLMRLQGSLFDRVLMLPAPDLRGREAILHVLVPRLAPELLEGLPEGEGEGQGRNRLLQRVGGMTAGFLPGDLVALTRVAALHAQMGSATGPDACEGEGGPVDPSQALARTLSAFGAARGRVSVAGWQGLAGGGEALGAKWTDVGGYEEVKARLKRLVEWPLRYPDTFARLGLRERPPPPPSSPSFLSFPASPGPSPSSSPFATGGILLHGPSGCGKSLLARVIAAEVGANFVELPASEVFSPYLGDSEARVRDAFARARRMTPCILFLDELDAMAEGRGMGGEGEGGPGSGGVYARVLSTLLNEMDGVSGQQEGLLVLAATNRRDAVDEALLRPGRLQESVLVTFPRPDLDFLSILEVATRRTPLHADVNLDELVTQVLKPHALSAKGGGAARGQITPAVLVALCREAALASLRETGDMEQAGANLHDAEVVVRQKHFMTAAAKIFSK